MIETRLTTRACLSVERPEGAHPGCPRGGKVDPQFSTIDPVASTRHKTHLPVLGGRRLAIMEPKGLSERLC